MPLLLVFINTNGSILLYSDGNDNAPYISSPQYFSSEYTLGGIFPYKQYVFYHSSYRTNNFYSKRSEDGKTISWYADLTSYKELATGITYATQAQLNTNGVIYNYIAIG